MKMIATKKSYLKCILDLIDGFGITYTKSMSLEETQLRIVYLNWFRNRVKEIPLLQLVIKLYGYQDYSRAPEYYIMKLVVNGKVRYELDSRDGYTKEELLAFMEDFTAAKNACERAQKNLSV